MRNAFLIVLMALFCAELSLADIYIKSVTRTDTYAGEKIKSSREKAVSTIWIGEDRIAYDTPEFKIILNKKENMLYFTNPKMKTYVAATVPLDLTKIVSENLKEHYGAAKTTGIVRETGKTIIAKPVIGRQQRYIKFGSKPQCDGTF